ncbi:MAG: hypothetical protein KC550_01030 [Nanoarchaeota archaeon]|nr:hypothetical protein [Nanoarchaeota archaeon]
MDTINDYGNENNSEDINNSESENIEDMSKKKKKNEFTIIGKISKLDSQIIIKDVFGFENKIEVLVTKPVDVKKYENELGIKIDTFSKDGKEYDYGDNTSYEKTNISFFKDDVSLEFKDLDLNSLKKVEILDSRNFKSEGRITKEEIMTPILNIEANNFFSSVVVLPKASDYLVKNILICSNYSNGNCLTLWENSGLKINQNSTHLWFEVNHFSAYVGVGPSYIFNDDFDDGSNLEIEKNTFETIFVNVSCDNTGNCGGLDVILSRYGAYNYFENFETSFGNWTADGGSCTWIRDQGGTPSANTGPDIDHTLGTASGWYVFVEASANACQGGDTTAALTSSTFSAGSIVTNMSFWYHMLGNSVGTLHLDVFNGLSWDTDLWTLSGAQQSATTDPFLNAFVDLSSYSGNIQIRFRYDGVSGWQADVALDDLQIYADGKLITNISSSPLWVMGNQVKSVSLNQGESQLVSFNLNASGNVSDIIPIFSMAKKQGNYSIASKSDDKNIIIADLQNPSGSKISPINNSFFVYNNLSFRGSASDNFGLDSAKLYIWNDDGSLYDTRVMNLGGNLSSSFKFDYNFSVAGDFLWNIEVNDSYGNKVFLGSNWSLSLSFPYLNIEYLGDFSNPFFVDQVEAREILVNVSCFNGNCGNINVTLFYEDLVETYNYFENFETGLGTWINTAGDQQDWTRDNGGTPSAGTGPSVDHTLGTGAGWYVYYETSNPVANGDQAYFESPSFSPNGVINFNYWYHMFGPDLGTLYLEFLNDTVWTQVWSVSGNLGDTWYNNNFNLEYSDNIKFRLIGERGTNWASDIGIDDLNISLFEYMFIKMPNSFSSPFWTNVTNSQTINLNENQSQVVSFYINASGDLLDTYPAYISSDILGIGSGADADLFNLTIADLLPPSGNKISPTNASYFTYNNMSFRGNASDNIGLDSAKLYIWKSDGSLYDTRVVYLNGNLSSSFKFNYNFSIAGDFLWNIEVNDSFNNKVFLGSNWTLNLSFPYLNINYIGNISDPFYINQYESREILVNVSCFNGNCGSINVTLFYEELVETYGYFENFETGLGSWTNVAGDEQDWTRDSGGTPSAGTGPSVDHTLGTGAGWYVYYETSNPVANGDQAYFESPVFSSGGTINFNYWYHMFGPDLGTIYLQYLDEGIWTDLWNVSGDKGDIWYNNNFNFDYSGNSQFRLIGERGTNFASDIAIDDLNISVNQYLFSKVSSFDDTPFWTNVTNSQTISLNENQSQVVSFYVNATENVLFSSRVFVDSIINSGIGSGAGASPFNITIAENILPSGYKISPINDSFFSVKDVNFIANVTDNNELGSATLYLWDENKNVFYTEVLDLTGFSSYLLNISYAFTKNGNYTWNIYLEDLVENSYWLDDGENWTLEVIFPNIVVEYIDIDSSFYAYQNEEINISFNVSCEGGNCGLVNVSLYYYDYLSYFENLESNFGLWTVDGGSCDWTRDQGGTPSGGTGPSLDNTLKTASGWYGYVEASANVCQGADTSAILTGPSFLNEKDDASFDFWYHMLGASIGTLHLDVYNEDAWINDVWSISGAQHGLETSPYTNAFVNLSSYSGEIITRFRYDGVTGFAADAAIDDINISYFGRVLVNSSSDLPMWVMNSNIKQVTLNQGESTVVTFSLNGTGELNSEYFIASAGISTIDSNIVGVSDDRNFVIVERIEESRDIMFNRNIKRVGNSLFEVNLSLRNLGEFQSPARKDLFVYAFVSDEFSLSSPFVFQSSSRYSSLNRSLGLNDVYGVNGTLFEFNISAISDGVGVLANYSGAWNGSNSWFVKFNLSGELDFFYDNMVLSGFGLIERE